MSLFLRLLGTFWLFYLILAQPGLPACWLEKNACEAHPHPGGHAAVPHTHEYLFEDVQTASPALPVRLIPARLLLEFLAQAGLWWQVSLEDTRSGGWFTLLDPPPPR
jgi:hypothetical protein